MTERRYGPNGERLCCPTVGGQPHTDACEAIWRASRNFNVADEVPAEIPAGTMSLEYVERGGQFRLPRLFRRRRGRHARGRGELDQAEKRETLSGETRPPWEKP